jgi:hypothetical protein
MLVKLRQVACLITLSDYHLSQAWEQQSSEKAVDRWTKAPYYKDGQYDWSVISPDGTAFANGGVPGTPGPKPQHPNDFPSQAWTNLYNSGGYHMHDYMQNGGGDAAQSLQKVVDPANQSASALTILKTNANESSSSMGGFHGALNQLQSAIQSAASAIRNIKIEAPTVWGAPTTSRDSLRTGMA